MNTIGHIVYALRANIDKCFVQKWLTGEQHGLFPFAEHFEGFPFPERKFTPQRLSLRVVDPMGCGSVR
jgi:hypothetical protein